MKFLNLNTGYSFDGLWQNYIDTNRKIGTPTILWEITISKCRALTHKLHKNQAYKEKLIRKALRYVKRFQKCESPGVDLV